MLTHDQYHSALELRRILVEFLDITQPRRRLAGSPTYQTCLEHHQLGPYSNLAKAGIELYKKINEYEHANYEQLR